jgi:hypothetical protein
METSKQCCGAWLWGELLNGDFQLIGPIPLTTRMVGDTESYQGADQNATSIEPASGGCRLRLPMAQGESERIVWSSSCLFDTVLRKKSIRT